MTRLERNKRIIEAIEQSTAKSLVSKKKARAALLADGIYTEDGKLRPEYGGTPRNKLSATA